MNNETTIRHIEPEDMADYFAGLLPEEQEEDIEEHFAGCDECTAHARRFHVFSQVWKSWTAKAHGEAYWRAMMDEALQQVAAQQPVWRERLQRWREQCEGKARAVVRVVMEQAGAAARIVTEGLEALLQPEEAWRFALEPVPVRVRGPVRTRGQAPAVVALAPGVSPARIAVSSAAHTVQVRVDHWPTEKPPPLVLLIPATERGTPRIAELKRQPDVVSLIAQFEQVEPGEYLVAFEPLEPGST
jgi:hypothetical protein